MHTDRWHERYLLFYYCERDSEQSMNLISEQHFNRCCEETVNQNSELNESKNFSGVAELLLTRLRQELPHYVTTVLTSSNSTVNSDVEAISNQTWTPEQTIDWLRQQQFDVALIVTPPDRSPYAIAYLCYLAGIPIRIGSSCEFGGGVLSTCITPADTASIVDAYLRFLHSSIPILCGSES